MSITKIKIGSTKELKGIEIEPKTILFNGNNVKILMKDDTELYRTDILATIEIFNTWDKERQTLYTQLNSDGTEKNSGIINSNNYSGDYFTIKWTSNNYYIYTLKSGYIYYVYINEDIEQVGTITADKRYTEGTIGSSLYTDNLKTLVARIKVYPLN